MKRLTVLTVIMLLTGILASACQPSIATQPSQPSPTSGQATAEPTLPPTGIPTAIPIQKETPAPTTLPTVAPMEAGGSVSGTLGYPADAMPAVRIVAFLIGTDTTFSADTKPGQMSYQLDGLEEGKYHVVAYTIGGGGFPAGLSGAYTQAVVCGMGETCTDHTLAEVAVKAGSVTQEVNLTDWLVPTPPQPLEGRSVLGAITGQLSYPSEFIPPMRVVAFRVSDNQAFYVDTVMNDGTYILPVPEGIYHVVAYVGGADSGPESMAAGYTKAVACGLSVDCTDHSLVDVNVVKGSVTYGINPGDYYAPAGSFPTAP